MAHFQLLLHLSCDRGAMAGSISSGVRHLLAARFPRLHLFLGSVVSGVVFYLIHIKLFSSVNK